MNRLDLARQLLVENIEAASLIAGTLTISVPSMEVCMEKGAMVSVHVKLPDGKMTPCSDVKTLKDIPITMLGPLSYEAAKLVPQVLENDHAAINVTGLRRAAVSEAADYMFTESENDPESSKIYSMASNVLCAIANQMKPAPRNTKTASSRP